MEVDKIVIVLLGPSGIGKTTFGKFISESRNDVMFLSTGEKLWEKGKLQPWKERDGNSIKQICHEMIKETFEKFGASTTHRILVLDCVKDLNDAEYVTSQATEQGLHVYRALFSSFDNAEILANCWNCRGVPRFSSPRKAEVYLRQWHENFAIVLNYYKKMNALSISPKERGVKRFVFAENLVEVGDDVFPIAASPNYLYFLLIDSAQWSSIYKNLLSVLRVDRFQFSIPASFVNCVRDVTWVANSARYHVTPKVNGVRFLLFKFENNNFLINANHEIFPCDIDVYGLPNNTVLDGELLPSISFADIQHGNHAHLGTSVLLVFDVLAVSSEIKWTLPCSMRQAALNELNINRNIATAINSAKASESTFYPVNLENLKRPTNPRKLTIKVALQVSHPSTPAEIESCLSSSNNLHHSFNGLIFTPETPYTFGTDSLSFKWQPENSIQCFISQGALESGQRPCNFPSSWFSSNRESVIECRWDNEGNSWEPLLPRNDKTTPDSEEMLDHLQKICLGPYDEWQLRSDLNRQREPLPSFESCYFNVIHPALTHDFDELHTLIDQRVNLNEVTKQTLESTGLEVFYYSSSSAPEDPISQLCQGLVLHPETKTVVTMPFVSFFAEAKRDDFVEATMKFDGSLGVAFQWNNEVKVTTKQGMDSREATTAKKWIEDNCDVHNFRKGYTYVFEIIFEENMAIVEYPFKGLVLLSVTNAEGYELPYGEMFEHGRSIGFFMVTPRMSGRLSDVLWYCAGKYLTPESIPQSSSTTSPSGVTQSVRSSNPAERYDFTESSPENATLSLSGAVPTRTRSHKGWVIRFQNGTRKKILYNWWSKASKVAKLVHPQNVWLLVKYDKIEEVFKDLPNRYRDEVERMTIALARQFFERLTNISNLLKILKTLTEFFHNLYYDLYCSLEPTEEEHPFRHPQRRRCSSDYRTPEYDLQFPEDGIDAVIDILTTQFFQALNVNDLTSPRQAREVFQHDCLESHSPACKPKEGERDSSLNAPFETSNFPFQTTNDIRQTLRQALERSSNIDKEQFLELCKNSMSYVGEDEAFLNFLVQETVSSSSVAKLPSCFCEEIQNMTYRAYGQIFELVFNPREPQFDSSLSADATQAHNEHPDQSPAFTGLKNSGLSNVLHLGQDVKEICDALSQNQVITENHRRILEKLNISPFYTKEQCNDLRIPVLDLIRPELPEISGYEPEINFQEKCGKHWKTLPIKSEELEVLHSILTPIYGPAIIFPNEILLSIWRLLDGKALALLSRVCKKFYGIVMQEREFVRKISLARSEHDRKVAESNIVTLGYSEEYSQDSYS